MKRHKAPRTHCKNGHPFTAGNVRVQRKWRADGGYCDYRVCLTCEAATNMRRRQRDLLLRPARTAKDLSACSEAEIRRTIALQGLYDRLHGIGHPTPLSWERVEIAQQMAALGG